MKRFFLPLTAISLAFTAPATAAEILINGDFETGDFTGWAALVGPGSNGNLFISTPGAASPFSTLPTAANPVGGSWYAITDQGGPGAYSLLQAFTLPDNTARADLTFQMFTNNQAGVSVVDPAGLDYTVVPNQHARVDVLVAGADPFSTAAGDVVANLYLGDDGFATPNPYLGYNFELLGLGLTPGNSYLLRFGEVDNQGFFQMGIDNVSLDVQAIPEPSAWGIMLLGFAAVGGVARRRAARSLASAA